MKRAIAAFFFALVFASAAFACGGDDSAPSSNAPPASECADGFAPDPRGFCAEIVTADACAPGTRPKLGSTACEPVGWTTECPAGMKKDDSGWGCVDAKAAPCTGSSREEASSGSCVTVGDCGAAFPPAGAIVVDASLTTPDATHFKTIGAAITAAMPGATIAIASGTYVEDVKIDKTLTLVGKCPAEVKITPASTTDPGIYVQNKAMGVVVRGVTVQAHVGGISVFDGSEATIEEVVVDGALSFGIIVDSSSATIRRSKVSNTALGPGNKGAWGIAAGDSDVSVDDVNVVGGTDAIYAGTVDTQISATRVVASGQQPASPNRSSGAYARGGRITIERSIFHDIVGDGALVAELPKAILEARETVVRGVKAGGSLARGYGVLAFNGGEVTLHGASVIGAESVGLLARDTGSILEAHDTVVLGPPQSFATPDENLVVTSERAGIGAQVVGNAKMTLDDVAIIGAWGWASYADTGGTLDVEHTLIDGTHALEPKRTPALPFAVGLSVSGATATVDDVSVLRTMLAAVSAGKGGVVTGKGLYVRDVAPTDPVGTGAGLAFGDGGRADLDGSAIVLSTTSGVLATHGGGAQVRLTRSTVHGTRAAPQGFGHGVIVAAQAEVLLDHTAVFENAAVGVAADGGRARLLSAVVAKNPVALHVQGGSFIVESADDADLGDDEVRVSPDSKFLDNATKVGSGEIPLPDNVLP